MSMFDNSIFVLDFFLYLAWHVVLGKMYGSSRMEKVSSHVDVNHTFMLLTITSISKYNDGRTIIIKGDGMMPEDAY